MPNNHSSATVQRLWNYCNALRDDSSEDSAGPSDPDVLAAEIMEDLQAALAQFSLILGAPEA